MARAGRSGKNRADRPYPGVLGEHILVPGRSHFSRKVSPNGPYLRSREQQGDDEDLFREALLEKLPLLFAHFGINPASPGAWQSLALSLAVAHVPGFQTRPTIGAPMKESFPALCALYRWAGKKQSQRKNAKPLTTTQICASLAKDGAFKASLPEFAECSPKRLQNLLSTARTKRRERVAFMLERARMKRSGLDRDDVPSGDPPVWIYARG